MFEQAIVCTGELSAVITRRDGTVEDLGAVSGPKPLRRELFEAPVAAQRWYERLWMKLRKSGVIPMAMSLGAFIAAHEISRHLGAGADSYGAPTLGVVTSAGASYMAADFLSASANRINAFNYHAIGTGGPHGATVSISGATNASPIVIATATAHGLTTNDLVAIASVGGNTNANGNWQIAVVDSTHFQLIGSTGNAAYTSGGTVQLINGAGDTALVTDSGLARIAGTQSNPAAGQYKTSATFTAVSTLSVIEWGLFSASTGGTLLDRRWFNTAGAPYTPATGAIAANPSGLNTGDTLTVNYTLTVNAGGQ